MHRQQFRILFRQFFFRAVEVESLSSHALGDSTKLIGRFASLLVLLSVGLALPAIFSTAPKAPALRLISAWNTELHLIAITMFAAAIIAILNWDAAFPSRRDIYILAAYPVRPSTLFWARAAAGAAAVGIAVLLLNSLPGLAWPAVLGANGTLRMRMPALGYLPAAEPGRWEEWLTRDLTPALPTQMGTTVGVLVGGKRRILAFGTSQPDSIYQIGSISKTFTGLLLAELVVDGTVKLDETVRRRRDVTLLQLATHRAGVPPMPRNLHGPSSNPALGYTIADLEEFFDRQFIPTLPPRPFLYSNAGFALLGQTLAARAGRAYEKLLAERIAEPLGLADTAVYLSESQHGRLITGHLVTGGPVEADDIGALAPAGGIYSTAADLLKYLEAQLAGHSAAIRLSQIPQAAVFPGHRIALAWIHEDATGDYWHNGAIAGYTAHARFNPQKGYAIVVLVNERLSVVNMADLIATYVRQRLDGQPAPSLAQIMIPDSGGLPAVVRMIFAWWAAVTLATLFTYCCLLVARGLPALFLPRAASLVQIAALCATSVVFVVALMGQPLIDVTGAGWQGWIPPYWFLGLLQQLNGSPALHSLAVRAWIAAGVAVALASAMFLLAYLHLVHRIAERPDISPGSRWGGFPLPRFGSAFTTAVTQFSIRSLARSRVHRLVLAFYLGIGLAFLVLLLRAPEHEDTLQISSIVILLCTLIGTRIAFALPVDLRANWLFRFTSVHAARDCVRATRRALWVMAGIPVLGGTAAACFWSGWPWQQTSGHVALLAGLGALVVEARVARFHRVPFACAYLPGKSQVHMAVLGGVMFLWCLSLSIRYERQVLESVAGTAALTALLVCVAAAVAWSTRPATEDEAVFEDEPQPAVQTLFNND